MYVEKNGSKSSESSKTIIFCLCSVLIKKPEGCKKEVIINTADNTDFFSSKMVKVADTKIDPIFRWPGLICLNMMFTSKNWMGTAKVKLAPWTQQLSSKNLAFQTKCLAR